MRAEPVGSGMAPTASCGLPLLPLAYSMALTSDVLSGRRPLPQASSFDPCTTI